MSSLSVVYDGVREPVIDVVSIPGLPELIPQYQLKDHNAWLRDVLSHQIPGARIMTFQYDFAKLSTSVTWNDLTDQVTRFLYALIHRREDPAQIRRPILFICYSFGAMILKKALLTASQAPEFRQIFKQTAGILFLGCLHDGTSAGFEDTLLRCAAVEFRATTKKHPVIESLKISQWSAIKEVMESFRELVTTFPVRSFFELRETVYQQGLWRVTKSSCLVPQDMSKLNWENERVIPADVDHVHLSAFPNRADSFFDVLMDSLTEIVNETCPPGLERPDEEWVNLTDLNASTASLSLFNNVAIPPGETLSSFEVPPQVKLPCFVTTPHQKNESFVGREDILQEIHTALGPRETSGSVQQTFAICGLGGMGKTQVALSYVFRHRDDFKIVLWAHADTQAKLAESYSRFAVELGLREEMASDPNSVAQFLRSWLEKTDETWLLVFDNADSDDKEELIRNLWPKCDRGSILITSRDRKLIRDFGGAELVALDSDSALNLLLTMIKFNNSKFNSKTIEEETIAGRKIVDRIGCLPLGIMQASNLISKDDCRLTEFLEAYSNKELIEDSRSMHYARNLTTHYQHSLHTVWNMNFERLSAEQQQFLNVMAFLDPDRIQLRLFSDGASKSDNHDLLFIASPRKLHLCKVGLVSSSLVSQNEELRELEMHRLVQASCHVRMEETDRHRSFKSAVSIMKQSWPFPPRNAVHNPSLWPEQMAFLPHVQSLCQYYVSSLLNGTPLIPEDEINWEFPRILYEAGWYCYERGLLELVAGLLEPAEIYCQRHIREGGALLLADIYGGIGSLYTESNNFRGAYDSFQSQWTYIQKAIETGELQRPTIWEVFGLGRIGNGYHGLQEYAKAEEYYRKCLIAWEGIPGDQKIFRTHLATCLRFQGRLLEAEQTVLEIIKDWNDTTNFRTGQALFSLGNIQIAQGHDLVKAEKTLEAGEKYQEASVTHTQSLILLEATLGERHHKTADAYYKMGWHFHRDRKYEKALLMLEEALSRYNDHSVFFKNEISRTLYKIGCVYQDKGDLIKGRAKIEEAENGRRALVPPEEWAPATDESDFDKLVQFWTR